eukprot:CAMPEP_0206231160 /NCGR_PEP_ID=MMETSP0047_2-20121206/10680_1 /ASSEMBLY_ACC=CAM_ASM_000192 /TAXON_ID=195065 /ORGANISM="Chroomonas mesostigmatica_cf, Strain CCMP1168" /LENGTH=50 /DNA_ID=CAMNT_0053654703 /DNA_START=461 /DNA_END=610 /DNA_ORIENTATION=+
MIPNTDKVQQHTAHCLPHTILCSFVYPGGRFLCTSRGQKASAADERREES